MTQQWTPSQGEAIEAKGSNLLVAAAAGSGKTAVLVARILRLVIQEGINLDELLIVTFTNAAAGEMRERIASAIVKALEEPQAQEEHIRKQLHLLNKASISTLHAFCIEVLRRNFHVIDLDPGFRIGETTEIGILQLEALEEVLEEAYAQGEEGFLQLVDAYGGNRGDSPLQELVLKVYRFIQSQPNPMEWLWQQINAFELSLEELDQSPWGQRIHQAIALRLQGAREMFREALQVSEMPGGPLVYREAILDDLAIVAELENGLGQGLVAFYEKLSAIKHKTLGRATKEVDEGLKEGAKELRDQGKKILDKLCEDYFALAPQDAIKDLQHMKPLMEALGRLVEAFTQRFTERKREKGLLDFNDLEHETLKVLADPMVAKTYQQQYKYIFVDEYQDSNIVQETIINRIKRRDNLFLVGDVKQSIYRFRLADPSLFIEKYETYSAEPNGLNRRIDLSKNFRSREEILAGVNYLFKHLMSKTLGEVDYTPEAYLYPGGSFQPIGENPIEVHLIEKDAPGDGLDEEIELLEDIQVEARVVAQRIKALLQEEIFDKQESTYRKIQYRDIVILLRATQNWAPTFLEVLSEAGIPAYGDTNTGYFETLEINLFMNLLKVLDNKRQDIPLLSVMRSPIGGFTPEELIEIRISHPRGSYHEAVFHYAQGDFSPLRERLREFLQKLNHWKAASRYMKLEEFIWWLFMETGFYHYVGAMPGGQQRQANLRVLLERAGQFQKTSLKGLFNFIYFIGKIQRTQGDMGSAKVLSENDNVVRLMSIHKSKGLEFPVVIVAGMGKQFNLRDTSEPVLLHKELGLGPQYVDPEARVTRDTLAKVAMKDQIKRENLSEEMRVLYVALTRPQDKLILVGSSRKIDKMCKKWVHGLGQYQLSMGKSYMDWIMGALLHHPQGEVLRSLAQVEISGEQLKQDASNWKIVVTDRSALMVEKSLAEDQMASLREMLKNPKPGSLETMEGEIARRLGWRYPREVALWIPSKLSVTDIKLGQMRQLESLGYRIPPLVRMPKFIEGKREFTGAEKGTILHFVLQHLDLDRVDTLEQLDEQLQQMVNKGLLTPEEGAVVQLDKLHRFFHSSIGQRMLQGDRVYREVPFNLKKRASEVLPGVGDTEEILLVQGIIDCYFQEGEDLVLLDYKSDFILGSDREEIKNKYRVQLDLYQEALEKITGRRVKERYLYLFYTEEGLYL